jgi:transaldolase
MTNNKNNSPLQQTADTTLTDYWNDSCSVEELKYAIENGAVGATTNPTIVLGVLKKEMNLWRDRLHQIIAENPTWNEEQITWKLIEEIAVKGAGLLAPVFEREKRMKGRISIQTNPANYRNPEALLEQSLHFNTLAPNMQIKIPVTKAGIKAIEEVTYNGASINATVSFTVPQAVAVAEAVERGLKRRQAEGKSITEMTPVCTIMVGRTDDWMHVLEKRDGILIPPGYSDWAGIACFKKAYGIYMERGYHTRLLVAAYRSHLHWSELIGGDIVLTIPYEWQKLFNASTIEVKERIQNPVSQEIIDTLYEKFADFRRAYDVDGLSVDEFDAYGPTVRTLRSFISSYHELIGIVRDFMLPNPDVK